MGLDEAVSATSSVWETDIAAKFYSAGGAVMQRHQLPLFKALNKVGTKNQELMIERIDGTRRWCLTTATPIFNDDGDLIAAFVVFPDITDQKSSEDAIRVSERRYRSIMEASPDPIVNYDMQGRVLYVNPAFSRVFGWTYAELVGEKIDYVPRNAQSATKAMLRRLQNGDGYGGFQTQRYDKQRRLIDVDISFGAWKDRSGTPVGSVVILRDVTERKRLQDQLRQAQKMESIGVLAGGIAHDFNNILGAMIGYTELSLQKADGQNLKGYLRKILQSGERAKALIQQILSFSRPTETRKSVIRINPIIKEVLKLLRATIPKSVDLIAHLDAENDSVHGDPTQIHQVLLNLITNAVHATQPKRSGSIDVYLQNRAFDSATDVGHFQLPPGDYLLLAVSDAGEGISAEHIDRIFDPYFTTKSKKEGTGMGLSIIHGIIKDHSGAIRVKSQVGVGTRFDIFFPVAEAVVAAEVVTTASDFRGSEHILLVDDEADLIGAYGELLESLGYRVTGMTSSVEALKAFRQAPPAVRYRSGRLRHAVHGRRPAGGRVDEDPAQSPGQYAHGIQ